MTVNLVWFQNSIANLSDDSQRLRVLSEIKIAISALNINQIQDLAHVVHLNNVFDCLNCSEKEQIELTCDILCVLLPALDLAGLLGQYSPAFLRAICHPACRVKEMVIKQLVVGINRDTTISRLCQEEELLLSVVNCVSHEDITVANAAVLFLTKLGTTSVGRSVILSSRVLHGLRETMSHNDTSRFRVYDVVVQISVHSAEGLAAVQETGLMSALLAELNGADVLLQLNTIELLTKLALCPHGLKFLERQGILSALLERIAPTINNTDALSSLLLPGLIKFFGNVAFIHPKETFAQFPGVVAAVFHTLNDDDLTLRGVAMETIGYIGSTVQGKMVLNSLGDVMPVTMSKLGTYMTVCPTDVRVRSLNTVANLLQLKVVHQNPQAMGVTQAWFERLTPTGGGAGGAELVLGVCRQPFPELRLAGLRVLLTLAEQPWGQHRINCTPGLVEFLLDRSQEASKLCKDAKYEIIQTLSTSPTAESVFDNTTLLRLREFVQQGPFYVHTQTEVAIEGAS